MFCQSVLHEGEAEKTEYRVTPVRDVFFVVTHSRLKRILLFRECFAKYTYAVIIRTDVVFSVYPRVLKLIKKYSHSRCFLVVECLVHSTEAERFSVYLPINVRTNTSLGTAKNEIVFQMKHTGMLY